MRLLLISCLFAPLVIGACYYPNGTQNNDWYQPCGAANRHSMCCRTGGGGALDRCLSDPVGLCQNGDMTWRESCTDPLWLADGCLKLCVNGTVKTASGSENMPDAHVVMTACQDGSFCCGDQSDATTCCKNGKGVWISNGKVVSTNPALSASSTSRPTSSKSPSTSAITSTSASASPTAGGDPSPAKSNTGTIVGAVVGGVGGLALIAGLTWFFLRRRNASKASLSSHEYYGHKTELHNDKVQHTEQPLLHQTSQGNIGEMPGSGVVEMGPTSPIKRVPPGELPG